jgi:hypothetical protein
MTTSLRFSLLLAAAFAIGCGTAASNQATGQQIASKSCKIDSQKICEEGKELKVTNPDGMMDSQSQREQNATPTQEWVYTFETPDKTTIQVSCNLNIQHHRVVYSRALVGSKLTDGDIDYLRTQGMCVD